MFSRWSARARLNINGRMTFEKEGGVHDHFEGSPQIFNVLLVWHCVSVRCKNWCVDFVFSTMQLVKTCVDQILKIDLGIDLISSTGTK
jgi:hypothetical protein